MLIHNWSTIIYLETEIYLPVKLFLKAVSDVKNQQSFAKMDNSFVYSFIMWVGLPFIYDRLHEKLVCH